MPGALWAKLFGSNIIERPLEGAHQFVVTGEGFPGSPNWGDAISWCQLPGSGGHDELTGEVVGWVPRDQWPRPGDAVLARSTNRPGQWGLYTVQSVSAAGGGVEDMFYAVVRGVCGYAKNVNGLTACERYHIPLLIK